ncbi:MAG: hypothetical protein H6Q76_886 [Firmicutes bacterium]|nr:hypothetical protein [Bacillota bacterium]
MNEASERFSLLIFAKSPDPGQVKTRIAEQVGLDKAAEIYEEMLDQILRESAAQEAWERILFITPESDADYFHRRGLKTRLQKGNDIGERMANALLDASNQDSEKIVLIGSDIPSLKHSDIVEAFAMLARVPAVIGPSEDGGFYLLGVAGQYVPRASELLRQAIAWSTPAVLAELEQWCQVYQFSLEYLPRKNDIDTYEDWIRYQNTC